MVLFVSPALLLTVAHREYHLSFAIIDDWCEEIDLGLGTSRQFHSEEEFICLTHVLQTVE